MLSPEELRKLDRLYYTSWPDNGAANFIGLDSSAQAIEYARAVELIEAGVIANLEEDPITAHDARTVRDVDVILSTGCIGYVTEKTFRSLLESNPRSRDAGPPPSRGFVSRPAADVRAVPLADIVTVCSGTQRPVGTRYVMVEHDEGRRIVLQP